MLSLATMRNVRRRKSEQKRAEIERQRMRVTDKMACDQLGFSVTYVDESTFRRV